MYFAEYMKKIRQENNLTQNEIAKILNVSSQSIKMIENGSTNFPSKILLDKLSDYLEKFPVEVASTIIFGEDDYERDEAGYLSNRYLAYKYINGWNIEKNPITLNYGTSKITFSAKIVKRREPKNTSLIVEFRDLTPFDQINKTMTIDEAYDVLATIMTIIIQNKESFRRVEVLFDIRDYYESATFQVLEDITVYRLPLEMILILFEPDTGAICHEVNIGKGTSKYRQ